MGGTDAGRYADLAEGVGEGFEGVEFIKDLDALVVLANTGSRHHMDIRLGPADIMDKKIDAAFLGRPQLTANQTRIR